MNEQKPKVRIYAVEDELYPFHFWGLSKENLPFPHADYDPTFLIDSDLWTEFCKTAEKFWRLYSEIEREIGGDGNIGDNMVEYTQKNCPYT